MADFIKKKLTKKANLMRVINKWIGDKLKRSTEMFSHKTNKSIKSIVK